MATNSDGQNVGRIVRVVGPVIDVEFDPDKMPGIYNALTIDGTTEMGDIHLLLEVEQHLEGGVVRAVAMDGTDGVTRGMDVIDTGAAMADAGRSGDARPHLERAGTVHRRRDRRGQGDLRHSPRAPRLRPARAGDSDLRDRHQGRRPARALHQGWQDRPVRRCGRRQDRHHHGADQQPRPGARRHVRVHRRRRAHP